MIKLIPANTAVPMVLTTRPPTAMTINNNPDSIATGSINFGIHSRVIYKLKLNKKQPFVSPPRISERAQPKVAISLGGRFPACVQI